MPLEPFLVNPPRRMLAYGLNPPRRRRKSKNPPAPVHIGAHNEVFWRDAGTGRFEKWPKHYGKKGKIRRHKSKKRRASPAPKRSVKMAKRRVMRRVKAVSVRRGHKGRFVSRRRNPVILGLNPRRRMIRRYRRNPAFLSKLRIPSLQELGGLALGAVGSKMLIARVLGMLPPVFTGSPIARAASRLGLSVLAAGGLRQFGGAKFDTAATAALAVQLPEVVNDLLSLAGVKLSDGEAELALYTLSGGEAPEQITASAPQPTMDLYTLSEADGVPVG